MGGAAISSSDTTACVWNLKPSNALTRLWDLESNPLSDCISSRHSLPLNDEHTHLSTTGLLSNLQFEESCIICLKTPIPIALQKLCENVSLLNQHNTIPNNFLRFNDKGGLRGLLQVDRQDLRRNVCVPTNCPGCNPGFRVCICGASHEVRNRQGLQAC